MPHNFWDFFNHSSSGEQQSPSSTRPRQGHNLQDGLFQIASQTCNLLVQVNNTNNISYGNGSTNIHLNHMGPGPSGSSGSRLSPEPEPGGSNSRTPTSVGEEIECLDDKEQQLLVLIPPTTKASSSVAIVGAHNNNNNLKAVKYRPGFLGKPRLSTVLEGPLGTTTEDDGGYNWHAYMPSSDSDGSPSRRWSNKNKWCRPSCIPISLICLLIFLVVLLPLLDQAADKAQQQLNANNSLTRPDLSACVHTCSLSLVETIPEGLNYTNTSAPQNPSTFDTWLDLINSAQSSIEIASFYWTLRQSEVYPDPSSIKGEVIFQSLLRAGTDPRITLRIAQNMPTQSSPNIDTELLVRRKAAQVRTLNFAKLLGGGVLHTKFWIIDRKHAYIGSANMDWRSLTQVKEMGVVIRNCRCLSEDLGKIFEVYWKLGEEGARIPDTWPANLSTSINLENPLNLTLDSNETFQAYISSSPPSFNPMGRTNDIDALLNVIQHAEKFIYIAVMDYFPLTIYTPKMKFWPVIDDAIKKAAIENHVQVKMLISRWNHSRPAEDYFLRSIASISRAYPRVSIEVRRFVVPSDKEQRKIPFARVNHNKYMVTDTTCFIGTSNWSGDYFTTTAGVSLVLHDPVYDRNASQSTLRSDLQMAFERDWYSSFSEPFSIDHSHDDIMSNNNHKNKNDKNSNSNNNNNNDKSD